MEEIICRVRAKIPILWRIEKDPEEGGEFDLVSLADLPDTPSMELRHNWTSAILQNLTDYATQSETEAELVDADDNFPRAWDFILNPNGSVEPVAPEIPSEGQTGVTYPASFSLPADTLFGLGELEIKKRAELFAFGGLLYEVISLKKPFSELGDDDEEIQARYSRGEFPHDVWNMTFSPAILSCWSLEFKTLIEEEIANNSRGFFTKVGDNIREHPLRSGFQALGGAAAVASVAAFPALGLLGFSSIGPVAGSVAAGLQSSVGLVQAGSVFAWCQSAAMGGVALGGLSTGGLAGAGVAAAATVPMVMPGPGLKEQFERVFRKGEVESRL